MGINCLWEYKNAIFSDGNIMIMDDYENSDYQLLLKNGEKAKFKGVEGEITAIDGQKITLKDSKGKSSTITEANAAQFQVGQQYTKAGMSPLTSLISTLLFALAIMSVGAVALGANVPRFALAFYPAVRRRPDRK